MGAIQHFVIMAARRTSADSEECAGSAGAATWSILSWNRGVTTWLDGHTAGSLPQQQLGVAATVGVRGSSRVWRAAPAHRLLIAVQPQGAQQSHFFVTVPPDAVAGQQLTVAAPNGTSVWFRSLPADFFPNARVQVAHDPASAPGAVQLVPDPDVVRSLEAMGFPAEHAARAALHEFGTEACVAWILRELQG